MQIPVFLCFSKNECELLQGKTEDCQEFLNKVKSQITDKNKTAILLNCEWKGNPKEEEVELILKYIYFVKIEESNTNPPVITLIEEHCIYLDNIPLSDETKSFLKKKELFNMDIGYIRKYGCNFLEKEELIKLTTLICIDIAKANNLNISKLSELITNTNKHLKPSDLAELVVDIHKQAKWDISDLAELIVDIYKQAKWDILDLAELIASIKDHQWFSDDLGILIADIHKQLKRKVNWNTSKLAQLTVLVCNLLKRKRKWFPRELIPNICKRLDDLNSHILAELIVTVYNQEKCLSKSDFDKLVATIYKEKKNLLKLDDLIIEIYKQLDNLTPSFLADLINSIIEDEDKEPEKLADLVVKIYRQLKDENFGPSFLIEIISTVAKDLEPEELTDLIVKIYQELNNLDPSFLADLINSIIEDEDKEPEKLADLVVKIYKKLDKHSSDLALLRTIAEIYKYNQDLNLTDLLFKVYKKLENEHSEDKQLEDPIDLATLAVGVCGLFFNKQNFHEISSHLKHQIDCTQTRVKFRIIELIKSSNHLAKQIVLYGPPGTGKTKLAQEIAKLIILDRTLESLSSETLDLISLCERNIKIVQLHPSYSYEDFIRSIHINISNNMPHYEVKDKVFAELCKTAETNREQNFVLIIDEINRANLPLILGELIYALEYRDKEVETPYGKIKVPENLYIIATMNTADRSVVDIDYAIRRRFTFFQVKADGNCIKNPKLRKFYNDVIDTIFDPENSYLNYDFKDLYDDIKVGHTYFLGSLETVAFKFVYQVIPLLIEYIKDGILTTTTLDFLKEYFEKDIKSIDIEDVKNKVSSLDISDESQK